MALKLDIRAVEIIKRTQNFTSKSHQKVKSRLLKRIKQQLSCQKRTKISFLDATRYNERKLQSGREKN